MHRDLSFWGNPRYVNLTEQSLSDSGRPEMGGIFIMLGCLGLGSLWLLCRYVGPNRFVEEIGEELAALFSKRFHGPVFRVADSDWLHNAHNVARCRRSVKYRFRPST